MRSRQHVVIARLNDKEYEIYERVLDVAKGCPKNKSERFRRVLFILNARLDREAAELFYQGLNV